MMHESGVEGRIRRKRKKVDWIVLPFDHKMTKALLEIQLCLLSVILRLQGALRVVSLSI